jgi:prepilin-type N-terminal cleavage/methylation domain-containing protein
MLAVRQPILKYRRLKAKRLNNKGCGEVMCRNRNRGFTLIELLVVLAIITIMISVAVATLSGVGTPKQQLRREAGSLTGLFKEARLAAMERKLKIDVYAEPSSRTVCAVESGYARKLLQDNPAFFSEGTDLAEHEPETNRFFRVTKFPEEIGIEAFTLNDIEPEKEGDEPLFEPAVEKDVAGEPSESNRPVFSFTHLGGASGGGISVVRDEIRIDIACDLLTGLPEIVRRRAVE